MKFNEKLKNFRLKNEKTQKQMAEIMGVDISNYVKYEYGTASPKVSKLILLKNHFGSLLDLNDLLVDD